MSGYLNHASVHPASPGPRAKLQSQMYILSMTTWAGVLGNDRKG